MKKLIDGVIYAGLFVGYLFLGAATVFALTLILKVYWSVVVATWSLW